MNFLDSTNLRLNVQRLGTLKPDYPTIHLNTQKLGEDIRLNTYQLQTVNAMRNLEMNASSDNEDDHLITELGILGNKVGSGKSYCILGLISHVPQLEIQPVVKYQFSNMIYMLDNRKSWVVTGSNLIVVPHHILKTVWEAYLKRTRFSTFVVKKKHFPIDYESLRNYDIVLCSSKIYNEFINDCTLVWSRVVFDEADTINIPACIKPKSRFTWLVTSSIKNILFPNGFYWKDEGMPMLVRVITKGISRTGFIKNTCKSLESMHANYILNNIIVKFNDAYIDDTLNLPKIHRRDVICKSPYFLHILNGILPENIINLLKADDCDSALAMLGCAVDTKANILKVVNDRCLTKKQNYLAKLVYLESLQLNANETAAHAKRVEATKELVSKMDRELAEIGQKIDTICDKIQHETCPICMDTSNDLCIFKCCMNIICTKCVKKLMIHQHLTCPLCRAPDNNILKLKTSEKSKSLSKLKSKDDQLVEILSEIPDAKILLFATFENTVNKMETFLRESDIGFKKLVGNQHSINHTVNEFNNGDVNILLLNANNHGCGLNLQKATHIIFYHKMASELENQIIGRAQRIGRSTSLNVINLLYEME